MLYIGTNLRTLLAQCFWTERAIDFTILCYRDKAKLDKSHNFAFFNQGFINMQVEVHVCTNLTQTRKSSEPL